MALVIYNGDRHEWHGSFNSYRAGLIPSALHISAPPPFNIIPTPKSVMYFAQWIRRKFFGQSKAIKKEHMKTIRVSRDVNEQIIYD